MLRLVMVLRLLTTICKSLQSDLGEQFSYQYLFDFQLKSSVFLFSVTIRSYRVLFNDASRHLSPAECIKVIENTVAEYEAFRPKS